MREFRVKLTVADRAALDAAFPLSRGSGDIGKRAIEIVKIYFQAQDPGCAFVEPPKGGDLAVRASGAADPTIYEVKGTTDNGLAWQQLKVSSAHSHALLTNGRASVLRVTDVYGVEPVVYEMRHGEHFVLVPEPRWSFKAVHEA